MKYSDAVGGTRGMPVPRFPFRGKKSGAVPQTYARVPAVVGQGGQRGVVRLPMTDDWKRDAKAVRMPLTLIPTTSPMLSILHPGPVRTFNGARSIVMKNQRTTFEEGAEQVRRKNNPLYPATASDRDENSVLAAVGWGAEPDRDEFGTYSQDSVETPDAADISIAIVTQGVTRNVFYAESKNSSVATQESIPYAEPSELFKTRHHDPSRPRTTMSL
ncbi:hypothetical protein DFH09DRAFT_1069607 [Mycena vulgaris]|nr:hypothetical protein DFH09DRAFT_1069607 [Mycena vulgaris]